ncbi:MAG: N-6 DNA methylase [Patescibacteria group bacterium]
MGITYKPQKEKVVSEPEEYLEFGQNKGYFALDGKKIKYLATDKKYNFSDSEEKVRAEYYFDLIEKYNYSAKRIDFEVKTKPDKDAADIVVYQDDELKQPYLVVECKKDGITDAEYKQAIEQVFRYANYLRAKFAAVVAGNTRTIFDVAGFKAGERDKNVISDLPVSYGKVPEFRFKKGDPNWDLKVVDQDELRRTFKKCHDTLWAGGKRASTTAFDEFAKIVFVKIRDEKRGRPLSAPYDFQIKTHESAESVFKRINDFYLKEKERDPEVFKENLKVEPQELYTVVEHLQSISLNKTDLDVKGEAFQQFMENFFKGDFGAFFTPRNIVNFATKMMDIKNDDLILDPACGSGGFLLHALDKIRKKADEFYPQDENREETANHKTYWHDFAQNNLFGIEINDSIARVAKMNMIIHDDGHTNVIGFDALDNIDNMNKKNHGFAKNKFDIILTNPPFGANVKASEHPYLEKFELGKKKNKDGKEKNMKNQKTEVLFIERCIDFLKPKTGRMAIVLPDGILTNSSLQYVRDYLMEKTQILAVVSLPQFAFTHFGAGVKSSLVFVRKKAENEKLGRYPIFMAIAEHIGYDATGRKDAKNDLDKICDEFKKFKQKK